MTGLPTVSRATDIEELTYPRDFPDVVGSITDQDIMATGLAIG